MANPPPAKRRRLNDALHRPFRSPLIKKDPNAPATIPRKSTLKPPGAVIEDKENRTPSQPLNKHLPTLTSSTLGEKSTYCTPPKPVLAGLPQSASKTPRFRPPSQQQSFFTPSKTPRTPASGVSTRHLESRILSTRRDIETLTQALSILNPPISTTSNSPVPAPEADLRALTIKWRTAARAAAEELYAINCTRIERAGGMGVWRERQMAQKQRRRQWEEDDWRAERERQIEEMKAQARVQGLSEREIVEMMRENEGIADYEGEADKGFTETPVLEEDFTMGRMLRSLGIEFGAVGYNGKNAAWEG